MRQKGERKRERDENDKCKISNDGRLRKGGVGGRKVENDFI